MRVLLAVPLAAALASPAFAQQPAGGAPAATASAPSRGNTPDDGMVAVQSGDIVVTAERLRGAVDAPQPPVVKLDEQDIAAYGAASLNDLIAQIAPETGSGRGRGSGGPVFLLNGQRISSFRELRDIPPEALRGLEVLPEEVALRYGYPPNQRIVNFLLKDHFDSRTLFGEYFRPQRGGTTDDGAQASLLRIDGPRRLNLSFRFNGTTLLTEAERGVRQTPPPANALIVAGDPDPAAARSLLASHREYVLNGTWATGLGEKGLGGSLSVNTTYTHTDDRALSGLTSVLLTDPAGATALRTLGGPLTRNAASDTAQLGTTLNKRLGRWQLTATADASYGETLTVADLRADTTALVLAAAAGTLPIAGPLPPAPPGGTQTGRQRDLGLSSLVTLSGTPVRLPAGEAALTIRAGYAYSNTRSSDSRTSPLPPSVARGDPSVGVNLTLPLTSKRYGVLGAVGDVTLNLSAGYDYLSDFGALTDWSAGVTWNLTGALGLQASYIVNQAAPSLTQLGAPVVTTFNTPVYDFVTGQSVLVTTISGGNRALAKQEQRDIKLGLTWQLPFLKRSNLIVEYFRNRSSNVTAAFPLLTPAIEAAFPGRVVRNGAGTIVQIDQRPVTFAQQDESRLRYGLNLSGRIGGAGGQGGGPGGPGGGGGFGGPPGGGGGFGGAPPGGGGFGGPPGGGRGGRWNLSIYHTVQFTDVVTVAAGGPVLDLLGGDALTTGGVARHSLTFEGGGFYSGFGLRLNGTWSAPTHVVASGVPGSSDLRFGSVFNVSARLFVELGRQQALVDAVPFFKGARMSLRVTNLFDSRQRVTDATGATPLAFQPEFLDPRGRVFGLDFRKMF